MKTNVFLAHLLRFGILLLLLLSAQINWVLIFILSPEQTNTHPHLTSNFQRRLVLCWVFFYFFFRWSDLINCKTETIYTTVTTTKRAARIKSIYGWRQRAHFTLTHTPGVRDHKLQQLSLYIRVWCENKMRNKKESMQKNEFFLERKAFFIFHTVSVDFIWDGIYSLFLCE